MTPSTTEIYTDVPTLSLPDARPISTESSRVSQGTVMAERPSSRATIGAKAKTMMTSFSATWLSVKWGSPSERLLQTKTIAVQGAAASRIRPAMRSEEHTSQLQSLMRTPYADILLTQTNTENT